MSAQQGSYACRITVDREVADVLRIEAKKVLMFNHEWFEEFLDFTPVGQEALEQLHRRRHDLGATSLDLLDDLDETEDNEQAAAIRAEITINSLAAQALDRLLTDYGRATAT
jgi:hypothetical protein